MNKRKTAAILIAVLFIMSLLPLEARAQSVLTEYLREGLRNNLVLKQKNISFQKALKALEIAGSYFQPSVALKVDYTSGEGGRAIAIPVGDMLNPVYATLNQLTGSTMFPRIDNVKEDFFPRRFYDAKLRASMPLLNTDIIYNREIQQLQSHVEVQEISKYRRELIRQIRTSYYQFLSAAAAVKIYQSALELAREGKRVNESLIKNGAGLPVYLLRSESEISALETKITESRNQAANARRYFNFLLNRDAEAEVIIDEAAGLDSAALRAVMETSEPGKREELAQLGTARMIRESVASMHRAHWVPKINAFVDFGAQDMIWNLKKDSRYYLFGFQFEVPLYEGFRALNKIEEAELDIRSAEIELDAVGRQLEMTRLKAKGELTAALEELASAGTQTNAARSYHALVSKGYKEGVHTFLEMLDARTQLTQSEILLSVRKYNVLIALAEYQRETANDTFLMQEEK